MQPDELRANLARGPAAGLYVVTAREADGFDNHLADECIAELVASVLAEDERREGLAAFDGDDFDLGGFLGAVQTLPMFGSSTVVVCRRAEKIKADAQEAVLTALGDLQASTVVVLSAAKLDGRTKFTKALKKLGTWIDVTSPTDPNELADWIQARVKAAGKSIDRALALTLARRCPRIEALAPQIAQMALFVGKAKAISEDAVHALGRREPEDNVFAITDALAARDAAGALQALQEAERSGAHYLELIGLIEGAVRRLGGIRAGLDEGLSNDAIAARLGVKRGAVYYQREKAQRWSTPALRALHDDVLTLEYKTKSGGGDPHLRLQAFVVRACAIAGR